MNIEWTMGLIGGMIIGVSVILMMYFLGRIAGISGMIKSSLFELDINSIWRVTFILGLVLGAALSVWVQPELFTQREGFAKPLLIASGLLVGLGTFWSNGCTSGHGVCGMARFSKRSIIATLTFMATAVIVVYVQAHVVST